MLERLSTSSLGRWIAFAGLLILPLLAYWPALSLPFISDDYLQVDLARQFAPVSQWPELAADALYRCRATSLIATFLTERIFGLNPVWFNLSSMLVHALNTLLVCALGSFSWIGWRVAAFAAACFAVLERPQEAVIWYASLPELLVFTFTLLAVLTWGRWLRDGSSIMYAAALAAYVLALLSKESAVALIGFLALVAWMEHAPLRRWVAAAAPFALIAALYFAASWSARQNHLHFNDGTFSLQAPFWVTLPASAFRLLLPWGLVAIAMLLFRRPPGAARLLLFAAGWLVIALLPYSFLTYMTRVPSRHTYLAAVAAALLLGAALQLLPRRAGAVGFALFFAYNVAYLWLYKMPQYEVRAQPTDELVRALKQHPSAQLTIHCFPYNQDVALRTVRLVTGQANPSIRWQPQNDPGCRDAIRFSFADAPGAAIQRAPPPPPLTH